jgi:hypothetical protein
VDSCAHPEAQKACSDKCPTCLPGLEGDSHLLRSRCVRLTCNSGATGRQADYDCVKHLQERVARGCAPRLGCLEVEVARRRTASLIVLNATKAAVEEGNIVPGITPPGAPHLVSVSLRGCAAAR